MPRTAWDKERIVKALRQLYKQGSELSYNKLARRRQSLVSAAAYHFGSYRRAVERAGIDYATISRRPRWTKLAIITQIKQARRKGEDLHWAAVTKRRDQLGLAAFASLQPRLFGRWDRALQAAGLDADDVAMYRRWDRDSILFELRGLARDKEPLNSGAVRHFGGYDAALRAAKLEPSDHRQRRRWSKEQVLAEIKSLYRPKKKPTTAMLRQDHSALYGAASRFFGGIPAALSAAGVRRSNSKKKRA